MFNRDLFVEEFAKTGLKKKFVCDKMGVSYDHFVKLTNGKLAWRVTEVDKVCAIIRWNKKMRERIFFAPEVDRNATEEE